MENLSLEIERLLATDEHLLTLDLARMLDVPEGHILLNLPQKWIKVLPGSQAREILEDLPSWGPFMTIIEKDGLIFEVVGEFPKGIDGYGYYNLNIGPVRNPSIPLDGHLKLENISDIVLISKPFKGKESYAFCFITHKGNCAFKVYLGRDDKHRLIPEQVERFKALMEKV